MDYVYYDEAANKVYLSSYPSVPPQYSYEWINLELLDITRENVSFCTYGTRQSCPKTALSFSLVNHVYMTNKGISSNKPNKTT